MDIFIYNGQQYTTYNLKKELKKMGITKNDITMVEPEKPKQDPIEKQPHFILINQDNNNSIWVHVSDKNDMPSNINEALEYCKKNGMIWDPSTKTGFGNYFTEEYILNLKFTTELNYE